MILDFTGTINHLDIALTPVKMNIGIVELIFFLNKFTLRRFDNNIQSCLMAFDVFFIYNLFSLKRHGGKQRAYKMSETFLINNAIILDNSTPLST